MSSDRCYKYVVPRRRRGQCSCKRTFAKYEASQLWRREGPYYRAQCLTGVKLGCRNKDQRDCETSRRFVVSPRGQVQDRRNAGVISQDTRYMFQMLRVTMRATAPPPPSPSSLLASDRGCWWCQACSWNVDTHSDSSSPGELTIKMLLLISILCVLFGLSLMYGPTSRNTIQIKSVWHSLYKYTVNTF